MGMTWSWGTRTPNLSYIYPSPPESHHMVVMACCVCSAYLRAARSRYSRSQELLSQQALDDKYRAPTRARLRPMHACIPVFPVPERVALMEGDAAERRRCRLELALDPSHLAVDARHLECIQTARMARRSVHQGPVDANDAWGPR